MSQFEEIKNRTVAITGATGFIGGRLVEVLRQKYDMRVRAILNRYSTAARISRYNIEMVHCNLKDKDSLRKAFEGCQYVIHCAYDWQDEKFNIDSAISIVQAAAQEKVKRLIHFSTISVYQQPSSGIWTEDLPKNPQNDSYGTNKLRVEKAILKSSTDNSQHTVVLQPSIVYGPWGYWTIGPLAQLSKHRVVLINNGKGLCNHVYIDDVIDATVLSLVHPNAVGETFLISGPKPALWKEFWNRYENILGVNSTLSLTESQVDMLIRKQKKRISNFEYIKKMMANPVAREKIIGIPALYSIFKIIIKCTPPKSRLLLINWIKKILNNTNVNDSNNLNEKPLLLPERNQIPLFTSTAVIDTSKAMQKIGFKARFTLDDGMSIVEQWAKWANLV